MPETTKIQLSKEPLNEDEIAQFDAAIRDMESGKTPAIKQTRIGTSGYFMPGNQLLRLDEIGGYETDYAQTGLQLNLGLRLLERGLSPIITHGDLEFDLGLSSMRGGEINLGSHREQAELSVGWRQNLLFADLPGQSGLFGQVSTGLGWGNNVFNFGKGFPLPTINALTGQVLLMGGLQFCGGNRWCAHLAAGYRWERSLSTLPTAYMNSGLAISLEISADLWAKPVTVVKYDRGDGILRDEVLERTLIRQGVEARRQEIQKQIEESQRELADERVKLGRKAKEVAEREDELAKKAEDLSTREKALQLRELEPPKTVEKNVYIEQQGTVSVPEGLDDIVRQSDNGNYVVERVYQSPLEIPLCFKGEAGTIPFHVDSQGHEYNPHLQEIASYLGENPEIVIKLISFATTQGKLIDNFELSVDRGNSVYDYLTRVLGVSPAQIQFKNGDDDLYVRGNKNDPNFRGNFKGDHRYFLPFPGKKTDIRNNCVYFEIVKK